jgi:putative phosphoesterase
MVYNFPEIKDVYTIGIISDTHALLRKEAVNALSGSDLVLHAGDIGDPDIIKRLESIAPVIAVRGNVDVTEALSKFPLKKIIRIGGKQILLVHNISDMDIKPEEKNIDIVVYGHSHKAAKEIKNGVLYFNPGSAGKKRFSYALGTGEIKISGGKVEGRLIPFPEV